MLMNSSPLIALAVTLLATSDWKVGVDGPFTIGKSLAEARKFLGFAGECIELHPKLRLEAEYQRREEHYYAALNQAEGIWGNQVDAPTSQSRLRPQRCSKQTVVTALRQVDLILDAETLLFRQRTSGIERGVWIGPLKLCRDTVRSTERGLDTDTGQPRLLMKLTKEAGISFASITSQSINRRLPVRLNGVIISSPTVFERMEEGSLQIIGPESAVLDSVRAIIGGAC